MGKGVRVPIGKGSAMTYDVVVMGGGMSSAATSRLARRGQCVLVLERFDILHPHG